MQLFYILVYEIIPNYKFIKIYNKARMEVAQCIMVQDKPEN